MLSVRIVRHFQEQQPSILCYSHSNRQSDVQYSSSSFLGQLP